MGSLIPKAEVQPAKGKKGKKKSTSKKRPVSKKAQKPKESLKDIMSNKIKAKVEGKEEEAWKI